MTANNKFQWRRVFLLFYFILNHSTCFHSAEQIELPEIRPNVSLDLPAESRDFIGLSHLARLFPISFFNRDDASSSSSSSATAATRDQRDPTEEELTVAADEKPATAAAGRPTKKLLNNELDNPNSYSNFIRNRFPGLMKYLPSVFTVVKFVNNDCQSGNLTGTCMTSSQCYARGGFGYEQCAGGYGLCCIFTRTCGQRVYHNNTYFVNPNYPAPFNLNSSSQSIQCDIKVFKSRLDVCQLRLDFDQFSLAGSSDCQLDRFTVPVTGSPVMCGQNTGQHVYVEFPYGVENILLPMTITSNAADRLFAIRIQQVQCGSPKQAPAGCLQYFTERNGIIQSFNYGDPLNNPMEGNRGYPPNSFYGMCIRKNRDFCGIRYVRGGPFMVGTAITDGSDGIQTGPACQPLPLSLPGRGDYIILPNTGTSSQIGVITDDRYCGDNFGNLETRTGPFVAYFVSDSNNNGEGGFRINFEQLSC